jgi:hypothetical protein
MRKWIHTTHHILDDRNTSTKTQQSRMHLPLSLTIKRGRGPGTEAMRTGATSARCCMQQASQVLHPSTT